MCFNRYMVDSADSEKVEASKNELHNLLEKPQLQGIPVIETAHIIATNKKSITNIFTATLFLLLTGSRTGK